MLQLSKNIKLIEKFIYNDLNERYEKYEGQREIIELYRKIIEFE